MPKFTMAPTQRLTAKQEKVLEFIEGYYADHGNAPTFSEIAAHFHFKSNNAVTDHLKMLEKKGYLEYRRGMSRSLIPARIHRIRQEEKEPGIPIVGTIAAGVPIEAVENVESYLTPQEAGLSNRDQSRFALRVRGESMIGRGIHDGDIVVIARQKTVGPHDVAAVRVGNEATLKYVRRDRNNIRLVPDNPLVKTLILCATDDVEILGKAVSLVRPRL
ncbi:MAG: repressor LexA [Elusimicrobia bacterium RIFOXYB2_FULL_49_7]|nr:MAG: repressor LexA [Elusimicrobia bacterium RIFOXYB2_FULL_49_7]